MKDRRKSLDDAWVEAALEEQVGGSVPPDLIGERDATRRGPESASVPRSLPIAAVAIVVLGLCSLIAVRMSRGGAVSPTPEESTAAEPPVVLVEPPIPEPAKVLLIGSDPSWEYRYLKSVLLRRFQARTWLLSADATVEHEHSWRGEGGALRALPEEFSAYDVVLISDVAPEQFGGAARERALREFCAAGGGVGLLPGSNGASTRYAGTVFAELSPAVTEPSDFVLPDMTVRVPGTAFAVGSALHSIAVLLERDRAPAFVDVWRRVAIGSARDGSSLVLAGPTSGDARPEPLIAIASFERGRTFVSGIDTWRWRSDVSTEAHEGFWVRVVEWLHQW